MHESSLISDSCYLTIRSYHILYLLIYVLTKLNYRCNPHVKDDSDLATAGTGSFTLDFESRLELNELNTGL